MARARTATPKKLASGKLAKVTQVPKGMVMKLTTVKYLR